MEGVLCKISQGELKGLEERDVQGGSFLSFLGIPYAKPPIGELRFKDPQPPEKWEGIRDATKEGSPCLSLQMAPSPEGEMAITVSGSEDCLFLNVFTKNVTQFKLKPVMVFIHGGGFISGSSARIMQGPEFLMTEDIVLVSIQYRLGALGFLSFDDPSLDVPGNAGLKDQVQALKWTRDNIKSFGGDPNNVTIFGISAGSASVHYLILSPSAKGLFHKAILQSGTALDPWACGVNDPRKLANILGFNNSDDESVLKFLQEISGTELVEGQKKLTDWLDARARRHLGPSVEISQNAFISKTPAKLVKELQYNQVPVIIGYCSMEGLILNALSVFGLPVDTENFVPYYFGLTSGTVEHTEINEKIKRFYSKDIPLADNEEALQKYLTDVLFLRGIYLTVRSHVRSEKPVYFYRMSLEAGLNLGKVMLKLNKFKGASHGDDMGYLFKTAVLPLEPDSPEEFYVKRFVKLWTNFARTGNPTPNHDPLFNTHWKPATEDEVNYLEIGTELVPGKDPDIERMRFWDQIIHPFTEFY